MEHPLLDPTAFDALGWAIADRVLAGTATADDEAAVRRWCVAHPDAYRALEALRRAFASSDAGQRRSAAELRARAEHARAIEVRHTPQAASQVGPMPVPHVSARVMPLGIHALHDWRTWTAVSVVAAVLVVSRHTARPVVGTSARVFATAAGQQAIVPLGDGTRITLAPGSRLGIPSNFDAGTRTIALEGEAYFEVARTTGAPFVVRTGGVDTRVLGTAFEVRHVAGRAVRVAVTSGKVTVTARGSRRSAITLVAGAVGEVTDSTATVVPPGGARTYTDWRRGELVCNETPAGDVLNELSRWFGYEFRVTDPTLARRRLTAVLSTQSSGEALSTLKELLDVDLVFHGNVVTISPHRDKRPAAPSRRGAGQELTPNQSEVGR